MSVNQTRGLPKRPVFLLLLTALACSGIWAQTLGFQGNARITLDGSTSASGTLTVRHRGAATDFFLTFGPGNGGSFEPRTMTDGTNDLSYYLVDNPASGTVLKDLSVSPNPGEVITGTFPEKNKGGWQSQEPSYTVQIAGGVFLQGNYDDGVTVSLYQGTLSDYTFVESTTLDISARVRPVLELAIVEPGGFFDETRTNYTIDFGILSPDSVGSADLVVRSNGLFSISMSSQNAGQMVHSDPGDPSTIPYDLYINSGLVDLSSGGTVTVLNSQGPTEITGQRYPLEVEIPQLGFPTEGSYSDSITITVAAN